MLMSLAYHYVPAEPAPKKSLRALKLRIIDNSLLSIIFFLIRMLPFFKLSYSNANFEYILKKQGTISNRALSETFTTTLSPNIPCSKQSKNCKFNKELWDH